MTKRIDTREPVLPLFAQRWSPRSFSDRVPEPGKLRSMFEAARLAPSAHNSQPARFVLARKERPEEYERLFACLSEGNRLWAHRAPVLVLAAASRRRFSQPDAAPVPYPHFMHDLGLAVMSFLLQGQAQGLSCHPMAGFDPERARAVLGIPELFEPGVMIAVGYLGSPDELPEDLRRRELAPRTRRPLEEVVFEGGWGRTSTLLLPDIEALLWTDMAVPAAPRADAAALRLELPCALPAEIRECPVARHGDWQLPLHPHAFGLEGADLSYQQRHVALVEAALGLIARHAPQLFDAFRRTIRMCALVPAAWADDDRSPPELPGSFIARVFDNPYEMADHFIHELQHNRLAAVEERGPFFEGDSGSTLAYSPWRDQPRGLYGIFHGVYVFLGVGRYWLGVHEAGSSPPDVAAYALDRLLRLPSQLELAIGVLRRQARLTPFGSSILDQFARDAEELNARIGLSGDAPAYRLAESGRYVPEGGGRSVRASLQEHQRLVAAG